MSECFQIDRKAAIRYSGLNSTITILLSKANPTVNWFVVIAAELGTVLGQVDHSDNGMLAVSTQRHSINTFMSTEKLVIWAGRKLDRILDNSPSILGKIILIKLLHTLVLSSFMYTYKFILLTIFKQKSQFTHK